MDRKTETKFVLEETLLRRRLTTISKERGRRVIKVQISIVGYTI